MSILWKKDASITALRSAVNELHSTNEQTPQQDDLRLSGPPSGLDAGGGALTRDRRIPVDLGTDSLATVPPKPRSALGMANNFKFSLQHGVVSGIHL
ncbi:hypothetical protein PoB_000387800 [Plakobranchus ocellatus]|uniref:Uncharacterized protein n=1 Tax=Plakobranchus ocellatus TaxID=259542 RepID=A0AAV3Y467_9GAST|nr:hypothetical protein PoB_000387800 [Plakobranchus ocellatus]